MTTHLSEFATSQVKYNTVFIFAPQQCGSNARQTIMCFAARFLVHCTTKESAVEREVSMCRNV